MNSYAEVLSISSEAGLENVAPEDQQLASQEAGYILPDIEDLVDLPKGRQMVSNAKVHFYLGGKLFSEKMPVVRVTIGADCPRFFINYEENLNKLT